jgi:hypothetical protein
VIALLAGAALVVVAFMSVLRTLVVPRGSRSRVVVIVSRAVREAFLVIVRRVPGYDTKDNLLALIAPVTLLALLVTWMLMFLFGYALMLLPTIDQGFGDALTESGSALFTLGFTVANGPSTAVHFAAAGTGLVVIALQIAYLPTIYGAFNRREMLVTLLESRAGAPAWGPELLARHQLVGIVDNLPSLYAEWEQWAADVAETHTTYPILIWFRSPHPLQSWIGGLLAVLDSAALFLAVAPSSAPSETRLCLRMGFTALRRIADVIRLPYDPDPLPGAPISLTYDEFVLSVGRLTAVGFPIERPPEEAWPHFAGWRVNYEALAYALADRVVAVPGLWSGERRHLPGPPLPPFRPPHRAPDQPQG